MITQSPITITNMNTPIPLAYSRTGNGSPLVLIHGFPLDSTIWSELIPLLEEHYDLIMPDLRGFGGSGTVDSQYTISDMADDIAALLEDLGVAEVRLAGHSMGGYVALAFAKRYPEKVTGLALVSSQAVGDSPDRKRGRYETAEEVSRVGAGVVVDAMAPKLTPNARIEILAREIMARQSEPGIIGGLKAMAEREDLRVSLASLAFPLVLIHGEADALIPVDQARDALTLVESARLVVLPGVGHMPMMEAPDATAEGLRLLG